ncbi:MAG: AtpZ/AtpI family protein [Alphaproteobacteria bacterium]|nr:AtpZ/AtpI family protein [Alphaproteobacteria bacterium]
MTGEPPFEPLQREAADLDELDAKLAVRAEALAARELAKKTKQDFSAMGAAMRVSADLLGGIVVGVAIAYGLAWLWPDFRALLLACGFVFGVGIGLYNAWRAANAEFSCNPGISNAANCLPPSKSLNPQSQKKTHVSSDK